ncbi:hypothetical protein QO034_06290 [Sedimentitalea sp. JM2-8]|uniref:Uncharacterized protein n=1 Tax=Sedimentitalea xiamensis TaxID=3050037 RepID=A0ABT7FC67_9RHOB|nr:hypothetical protein [Sedimentitalea xiamensis]MDK3072712.1 hypothetical protein [Sedimentitalea xiamensis]
MADRPPALSTRILAVLPFALPVLGGVLGVAWVNATAHGSPVLGIAAGAVAGWILAAVVSRVLGGDQDTGLRRTKDAETERD